MINLFTKRAATIAAATSIALFGGAMTLVTPAANAYTTCNSYGGRTSCYGSGGSSYNSSTYGGRTSYYGTDSNGNSYSGSCSSNSFTGTTTCF